MLQCWKYYFSRSVTLAIGFVRKLNKFQCYWTYKDGAFVHPETKEPMVTKELLILGTADVNFVETFMGLFHKMGMFVYYLNTNLFLKF